MLGAVVLAGAVVAVGVAVATVGVGWVTAGDTGAGAASVVLVDVLGGPVGVTSAEVDAHMP